MHTANPTEVVWNWSDIYPNYTERMAAMAHPFNVANAFIDASFLFLIPLKD